MKWARFNAVSLIEQTVTRELMAIYDEVFPQAFDVNVAPKKAGTTLSDGINKYFFVFYVWFLWPQFRILIVTLIGKA
jgi:hypothetical protein